MQTSQEHRQEVVTYYEDTGLDYSEWSKEFNMHFGYYKFFMNPFRREPMLEAMNQQVFRHLQLTSDDNLVYDMGCGVAAPCRSFAKRYPGKKIKGITIVPWQVEKANALNKAANLEHAVEIVLGDYTNTTFADHSADAIYALESSCHCEGLDKAAFISEMLRLLKPGKHFVIIDGFIKKDPEKFGPLTKYCYTEIIKGWALPSFPHLGYMLDVLKKNGAENLVVSDLSFRIAPSVMHAPFAVLYFAIKKMLQGEKLNRVRIGHLKACFLGLILGLHRRKFSYCMITGTGKVS